MLLADLVLVLVILMVVCLVLLVVLICQVSILIQRENSEADVRTHIAKVLTHMSDRMD